jgi:flavin reductase (DIM6/NTAB) family NADH-FMN oxidoreductase RutF
LPIDPRTFRSALGSFASGVTVVTTIDPRTAEKVGVTVSAFSSLSLDPPQVLFCLGRAGASVAAFEASGRFAVNILADDQRDVSGRFAGPVEARWTGQAWEPLESGIPALVGCLAVLDCAVARIVDGGDHLIFIGDVEGIRLSEGGRPLLYHRGGYL